MDDPEFYSFNKIWRICILIEIRYLISEMQIRDRQLHRIRKGGWRMRT